MWSYLSLVCLQVKLSHLYIFKTIDWLFLSFCQSVFVPLTRRLRVVHLSLSLSCVTRKKSARKNSRVKSWGETRDSRPQEFARPVFYRGFPSRHARQTKRKTQEWLLVVFLHETRVWERLYLGWYSPYWWLISLYFWLLFARLWILRADNHVDRNRCEVSCLSLFLFVSVFNFTLA